MNEILSAVGHTPLIELKLDQPEAVRIFAKLESVNPGGSLKDRSVRRILKDAIERGDLADGRRLIDSSSGNAGIAYAMLGAALGVPVTLVVPGNASQERLDRIRSHGAELIETDPIEGYDFAIHEARRLATDNPERYWYANQYGNESNWRAHYEETAPEILEQLQGFGVSAPDAFVGGVGTGGSITGIGRRIKEANPSAQVVAVIPDLFPGIEGLKPLGNPDDLVPEILDQELIDQRFELRIEDAITMIQKVATKGLFVGPSSGAYVAAALKYAKTLDHGTIVTLLNDTGERYTSTGVWSSINTVGQSA